MIKGNPAIHRHQEEARKFNRAATKSENRTLKRKYGLIVEVHPVRGHLIKVRADSGEMIGGTDGKGEWIPLEGGEMLTKTIGRPQAGKHRVVVEYAGEAVLSSHARIISTSPNSAFGSNPAENTKEVGVFAVFAPP